MESYQERYIENVRTIDSLNDYSQEPGEDFSAWYEKRLHNEALSEELRQENIRILN